MAAKPSHDDFIGELALGRTYGIFIDDTGSPGMREPLPNLHPLRKSWIGVVIEPAVMPEVLEQLPLALAELRAQTGATEFHFADIWAGKNQFKGVDFRVRMAIFAFMAKIFDEYCFRCFVQTFDPETLASLQRQVSLPHVDYFDLTKPPDTALLFLLFRIRKYLADKRDERNTLARVFVDEGFKKAGVSIIVPPWSDTFVGGMVCFASSSTVLPIQLADFAAYALNRTQILINRQQLGERDRMLLQILSPVSNCFHNIPKVIIRSPTP